MNLSIETPNIETYVLTLDDSDQYGRECPYASFSFDKDNFILTIESERGSYQTRWVPTNSESFMQLMIRIDETYLLDKIGNRCALDVQESKNNLIDEIRSYFSTNEANALVNYVNNYRVIIANDFINMMCKKEDIFRANFDPYCIMEFDYSKSDKLICEIFKTYIQPRIKKEWG